MKERIHKNENEIKRKNKTEQENKKKEKKGNKKFYESTVQDINVLGDTIRDMITEKEVPDNTTALGQEKRHIKRNMSDEELFTGNVQNEGE